MAPVDKVRTRVLERKVVEVEENLRKAVLDIQKGKNIYQVLAEAKVPRADIHKFFVDRWRQWQSQIIQNYQTFSGEADVKPVQMSDFNNHNPGNLLGDQGEHMLFDGFFGAKAMSVKSTEGGEEAEPLTQQELEAMAQGTLEEWESFMGDLWSQVLDQQMVRDYQQRMGEIQAQVRKLIAMAKSGAVGIEYVLIALAKVNVAKNGVLFTWLTKKAFGINEQMMRASDELHGMSAADPNYFSTLQQTQAETREGGFQLGMITNDLQKVMQNVSSTMETVNGIMSEINRFRRELITKFAAR